MGGVLRVVRLRAVVRELLARGAQRLRVAAALGVAAVGAAVAVRTAP